MIIQIPYTDGEHKACAMAPQAILEELKHIWSNSKLHGFKTPETKICSIDSMQDGSIYLGGDHTITYYTVKHLAKKYKDLGFIVFDAHPDVYQQFAHPTHPDYLKFLIEENILDPKNIIAIGIRAAHPTEITYYKQKGIKYITFDNFDAETVADTVTEFFKDFSSVYLSIDLDAIDPAFAPGVSYIEPCGITSREIFYILKRIKKLPNLKAMDIVELNSDNDINGMTTKLAAKIVAEFL